MYLPPEVAHQALTYAARAVGQHLAARAALAQAAAAHRSLDVEEARISAERDIRLTELATNERMAIEKANLIREITATMAEAHKVQISAVMEVFRRSTDLLEREIQILQDRMTDVNNNYRAAATADEKQELRSERRMLDNQIADIRKDLKIMNVDILNGLQQNQLRLR